MVRRHARACHRRPGNSTANRTPALESEGHEVVEAPNGRAGLTAFRHQPADVVVTDILMPEMDGFETIRSLRAIAPDLRIIAISDRRASLDLLRYAREFGATVTIAKPFRRAELLAAVQGETEPRP